MEEQNRTKAAGLSAVGQTKLQKAAEDLQYNSQINPTFKKSLKAVPKKELSGNKITNEQIKKNVLGKLRGSKERKIVEESGLATKEDIEKYAPLTRFEKAKKEGKDKVKGYIKKIALRLVLAIGPGGWIIIILVIAIIIFASFFFFKTRGATRADFRDSFVEAGAKCTFEAPVQAVGNIFAFLTKTSPLTSGDPNLITCFVQNSYTRVVDRAEANRAALAGVQGVATTDDICLESSRQIGLTYCKTEFKTQIGESQKCNVFFNGIQVGQVIGDSPELISSRALALCGQ